MSYLQRQIDAQNRDLHEARAYLDRADTENRDLSVEERTAWDALNTQMDERAGVIESLRADEKRALIVEDAVAQAPEVRGGPATDPNKVSDLDVLRKLAKGEIRSHTFGQPDYNEVRALSMGTTTAGGYTVPESFGGRIIAKLLTVGPMLDESVVSLIQTSHMQDIPFPIENARPAGTAIAENAGYAVSDSSWTEATLKAWKYGTLSVGSEELFASEEVGLQAFLAGQLGVAVGTAVNSILTLGTGVVQPDGLVHGAGSGVTGGTGVSGVATYENLVDLEHSVDSLYANSPKAGWMLRRASLGSVRKIQDGSGRYIFVERASQFTPATILGYPVHENPYVAAMATNAKSIFFGDWSYMIVRQGGGINMERNDNVRWENDQIAFKIRTWVDSFVGQSEAIKYFAGGTA